MNKLEKNFMKIIPYIFIAHMAFMASNSLCMLTVLTKPSFRTSKTIFCTQQRSFCSIPTLSPERYMALCNQSKRNKEKLRKLQQDPNANLRDIWRLKDTITKNHRILAASKLNSSDEVTE